MKKKINLFLTLLILFFINGNLFGQKSKSVPVANPTAKKSGQQPVAPASKNKTGQLPGGLPAPPGKNASKEAYETFLAKHPYIAEKELEKGQPDYPNRAAEFDYIMTMDPALGYPPRERLAVPRQKVKERLLQKNMPGSNGLPWVERGPSNVGGRTRALMFDPNDITQKSVWAGSVSGGLWFTNDITDPDVPWQQILDANLTTKLSVSCITYDPQSPNIFYLGTGELWGWGASYVGGNPSDPSQGGVTLSRFRGAGIFKSEDGGSSWIHLTNVIDNQWIKKLIVDPVTHIVYAATDIGFYFSDALVTSFTPTADPFLSFADIDDIEISSDGFLWAAVHNIGVYKSNNGGQNWNQVAGVGILGNFPDAGMGRIEIATAPSNPNYCYAIVQGDSGIKGIFATFNGGTTWNVCERPLSNDPNNPNNFKQAGYNLIAAVDPNDPNTVMVGALDLFRSTFAGTGWQQISHWYGGFGLQNVHADQHAIVFKPGSSSEVVFGNDGGVFYSSNANAATPAISKRNSSYNVTQFYSCAIHPTNPNYFLSGAQDNGTQQFNGPGIVETSEAFGGDGGYCFIDQDNPSMQIVSTQYVNYYLSTDGGTSFSSTILSEGSPSGFFINPSDYDDVNNLLFAYRNKHSIYRISDIGGTNATDVIPIRYVSHIRVTHEYDLSTTLFVGSASGKVYKVTNADGLNPIVTRISDGIPPNGLPTGWISCIEVGATNDELLVTYSSFGIPHVWYTNDGGQNWISKANFTAPLASFLPDMPVKWAMFNPLECGEVILATEVGVWSTTDIYANDVTWIPSNTGLANVRTDMFQYRSSDHTVIAATHGRGLYSGVFQGPGTGGCCSVNQQRVLSGTIYNMANTPVFKTNNFKTLEVDGRNNIWAGSSGYGVSVFGCQWDSAYNQFYNTGFIVRSMRRNPADSNVWIGMSRTSPCLGYVGGIYAYSNQSTYTRYLPSQNALPSLVVRSLDFNRFTEENWAGCTPQTCEPVETTGGLAYLTNVVYNSIEASIPEYDTWVYSLTSDTDGNVYAGIGKSCLNGCQDPYIARFTSTGLYLGRYDATNTPLPWTTQTLIRALYYDSHGRLWVGGNFSGLGVLDTDGIWHYLNSDSIPFPIGAAMNFDAITEGPDGTIYFGTTNGMLRCTAMGNLFSLSCNWERYTILGMTTQSINSIRFDVQEGMWLATNEGIFANPVRPCLTIVASSTNIRCNPDVDNEGGEVFISAEGGMPPYSGDVGFHFGEGVGSHTYTVTDANGNTVDTTITITQPDYFSASFTNRQNVTCSGGHNGSVEIIATGGTPPYSGDIGSHFGFTAGTYTFTVTDANNCPASASVTINEPPGPPLTADTSNVVAISCNGPGNDGAVTIIASGGTPPYSGDIGIQDSLSAGFHNFTVTDANGCEASVSVTFNQPDTANAGPDQSNCNLFDHFFLNANPPPVGETGHWEVILGSGTFFPDSTDPSPTVHDFTYGMNQYVWVLTCGPGENKDTVDVYVPPLSSFNGMTITSSVAGVPDVNNVIQISVCSGTPITFTRTGGEAGLNGEFHWYAGSCNPSQPGFDSTNSSVTVTPTFTTLYSIVAKSFCNSVGCLSFANVTVHASTPEVCNGIDDDCDGTIDNGFPLSTFFRDADGDGFGNLNIAVQACAAPPGFVANSLDCDDSNSLIHLGGTEVCNGIDDNCDGNIDEGFPLSIFFRDADADGFGNAAISQLACVAPFGFVANSTDCNDGNSAIHPGANEVCNGFDDDCNSQIDDGVQLTFFRDADNDGFGNANITTQACTAPAGFVSNNTDCNDGNVAVNPGATEVCNSIDDNCNGQTDEGVLITFFRDADGDGFGDLAVTTQACSAPAGFVSNSSDCNDASNGVNPNASETCNGIDDNCNGQIDDGVLITFYNDADGDGFGNPAITTQACSAPAGFVSDNTDCNDNSTSIHPGANEVCNGIDENCNGQIDEGVQLTFYRDADNDGFGNPGITTLACTIPAGFVTDNTDCNDGSTAAHPGATELCNGIDDNCNGQIDENTQALFYQDADGDGYGNPGVSNLACNPLPGYVSDNTDCNDASQSVHPGATEVCNAIDDNCNGQIDEGCPALFTYYADVDNDNFGNPNSSISSNSSTPPAGFVSNNTDCNDANSAVHPGATEVCNSVDDNCNGQTDEGVLITFFRDADGDGFGNVNITTQSCSLPAGFVTNNTDCNDANPAVNPGATEVCNNGIDDNCNGQTDEGVIPANPGAISGPSQAVCQNTANTYSVAPQTGVTFNWTPPTNANIMSGQGTNNVSVNFTNVFTSGTLSVTATSTCATSAASQLFISSTAPVPASISGPTPVCRNSSQLYSCPTVAGATSYNWKGPAGSKITSGQGTTNVTVKFGNNSGNVQVRSSNTCGFSAYQSLAVTVNSCARLAGEDGINISDLTVYPNPADNTFTLQFNSISIFDYQMKLVDVLSREVLNERGITIEGKNELSISTSEVNAGIYQLQLIVGNEIRFVKIVIAH